MTGAGRDRFASYRQRLDALGFRPSSARGQNFLLDPSLHRVIADSAAPAPRDVVLEIGVGLGFLSRELAPRCGRLVGVEIDDRLLELARADLAEFANVVLLGVDALGGPGRTLHPDVLAAARPAAPGDGALLVVANLPYSVSGPLLAELACMPQVADRAVVLVQKELGVRIAAPAGEPDYGGLAALLQAVFTVRVVRVVPPEVFRPRPKVDSVLVRLQRRPDGRLGGETERRSFAAFVRGLFQQRRKTMRTTLAAAAQAIGGGVPAALTADFLRQRAEMLAADQLVALWRQVIPGVGQGQR